MHRPFILAETCPCASDGFLVLALADLFFVRGKLNSLLTHKQTDGLGLLLRYIFPSPSKKFKIVRTLHTQRTATSPVVKIRDVFPSSRLFPAYLPLRDSSHSNADR